MITSKLNHISEAIEGYFLVFNRAKEIMGGYEWIITEYAPKARICALPNDITYLQSDW